MPLRAALMRIMRIVRVMRVAVGAPMSNNYPICYSSPEPFQTAAPQTHGVYRDAPILSDGSDKSDKSDLSVTPPQQAYPRSHQASPAYPIGNFSPEPNQTAASKPSGYHMTCHGVARQGEDGRPYLVRQVGQVRQVRFKRHATETRIPPQPSSKPSIPHRQLFARAPTAAQQTATVIQNLTAKNYRKNSKKSGCSVLTKQVVHVKLVHRRGFTR